MSRMGVLVAVVSGLFYAAPWIMDNCSGILTCRALIDSADMIVNNRHIFAVGSIIGILIAPLSLYVLDRECSEKESVVQEYSKNNGAMAAAPTLCGCPQENSDGSSINS